MEEASDQCIHCLFSLEPRHEISNNLTCVDSDEPLHPPVKLRIFKW